MDDLIKLSLLDEIDTQCLLAIDSFKEIQALINNNRTIQSKKVWQHLQAFLAHSGILGSLIFKQGNPKKTKAVTNYLKAELLMSDDSPIKERAGRNYLEHIEVFEIYASNRKVTKGIIQSVFANRKGFDYLDSKRYYFKRAIISDEMIFAFQNQESIKELELIPILNEVKRILQEAESARNRLDIIHF